MTLFQLVVVIMGFVFLLFAVDLYQRRKFNLLHFLVFFWGTAIIVLFGMRQDLLDQFGQFFGIARGADLIVYLGVISLSYLYLNLVNTESKKVAELTKLVSWLASQWVERNDIIKFSKQKWPAFLIRAYNEWTVIQSVLESVLAAGYNKILLCDDWSTDNTQEIIESLQQDNPWIIYMKHPVNRGWWAANKTLFSFVSQYKTLLNTTWYITYDADGQMKIEDVMLFEKAAKEHKESKIFLWSRFIKWGIAKNISVPRRIILRGSKIITFIFDQIWVSDPHNWFRMIHKDAISMIKITSDWMAYASDLIAQIQEKKIPYTEVPVSISYTEYSRKKGQKDGNAFSILKEILLRLFVYK